MRHDASFLEARCLHRVARTGWRGPVLPLGHPTDGRGCRTASQVHTAVTREREKRLTRAADIRARVFDVGVRCGGAGGCGCGGWGAVKGRELRVWVWVLGSGKRTRIAGLRVQRPQYASVRARVGGLGRNLRLWEGRSGRRGEGEAKGAGEQAARGAGSAGNAGKGKPAARGGVSGAGQGKRGSRGRGSGDRGEG